MSLERDEADTLHSQVPPVRGALEPRTAVESLEWNSRAACYGKLPRSMANVEILMFPNVGGIIDRFTSVASSKSLPVDL